MRFDGRMGFNSTVSYLEGESAAISLPQMVIARDVQIYQLVSDVEWCGLSIAGISW